MKKAIFLDRDGTIIVDKIYLNDPKEIEYLPRAIEGLKLMRDLGYALVVVTNQSGIARGLVDIRNLYAIHEMMKSHLASQGIDVLGFYYAPYAVDTDHFMRKPNPGMLLTAARDFGIDLKSSWMIGDRASDVEAGIRAQARSLLLTSSNGETHARAQANCRDLVECASVITQYN